MAHMRVRTLGDGTKMLVPQPGTDGPREPLCFTRRETAVLKQARNLAESQAYATQTRASVMAASRLEPWTAEAGPPALLPPRVIQPPPSSCWFLDDHLITRRPRFEPVPSLEEFEGR